MKQIKDYKDTKTYIYVKNKAEYIKLLPLLNEVFDNWVKESYDRGYNYINLNYDSLEKNSELEQEYIIYNASDFLDNNSSNYWW